MFLPKHSSQIGCSVACWQIFCATTLFVTRNIETTLRHASHKGHSVFLCLQRSSCGANASKI
jgi:hypothetical protein